MRTVLLCLCAALVVAACGKKGNPLPPLVRVPAAPGDFAVSRFHDQAFVRLSAPATNIDGVRPADVARVEVYALTIEGAPADLSLLEPDELRELSTLVASTPVRRVPLPPPPPEAGAPAVPLPPVPPGIDQGEAFIHREPLTAETRVAVEVPQPRDRLEDTEVIDVPRALVAPPPGAGLQRYYFAVAVSPRGRYGPHTALVPAPLAATSGPPSAPQITVDESSMTIRWTPPVDARGFGLAGEADWLDARPTVPGPPPTTYEVYEVPANASPDAPVAMPVPLTSEPTAETEWRRSDVTLGAERCFAVRAVDIIDGLHVRGPASPIACASFADTFAPPAPRELVAVAVPSGINLIWEPSDAPDLAGYLVLRAEAGSDTLTALMTTPVTTPSFRDESVKTGVRYLYAVVAVDRAGNRSDQSNRVEETAQ